MVMDEVAPILYLQTDRDREAEGDRRLDRGWHAGEDRDEACEGGLAADREEELLGALPEEHCARDRSHGPQGRQRTFPPRFRPDNGR